MLIGCYLLFYQNSSFIHYFKWQKFEFKQLIDIVTDEAINLTSEKHDPCA